MSDCGLTDEARKLGIRCKFWVHCNTCEYFEKNELKSEKVSEQTYKFCEVTDLKMDIEFSKGPDVGEFKKGSIKRELFIIYEGPSMSENEEMFFDELKMFLKG